MRGLENSWFIQAIKRTTVLVNCHIYLVFAIHVLLNFRTSVAISQRFSQPTRHVTSLNRISPILSYKLAEIMIHFQFVSLCLMRRKMMIAGWDGRQFHVLPLLGQTRSPDTVNICKAPPTSQASSPPPSAYLICENIFYELLRLGS